MGASPRLRINRLNQDRAFLIREDIMRQPIFVIPLLVLFCIGDASSANKKIVSPLGAKPGGNYSQGILTGDTLYISGQGGEDASGKISSDFGATARK
jgi:hypothetical protein